MAAVHCLCLFFLLSGLPSCFRLCSSLQPASSSSASAAAVSATYPSHPFSASSSSGNQSPASSEDQIRRQAHRLRSLPPATADAAASLEMLLLLEKVLDAMENGLSFMERVEDVLNLDAIIGSRIVEGQLSVLISRLQEGNALNAVQLRLPVDIVRRIERIQRTADAISYRAIPSIRQRQPAYYNRLNAILGRGFWSLSYPSRKINASDVIRPMIKGEAMKESQSDDCLTELFGTSGKTPQKCRISRGCWKLMTSVGYQHYALTHQVFYTEIGTAFGCFSGKVRKLTDRLSDGFCANILVEAESIAASAYPHDKKDLFMEQAALCGVLGFDEFFRKPWLDAILHWQRKPEGCWGEYSSGEDENRSRFKREERVLDGGCRCHRTAVAIGALVGYVRFLSESLGSRYNLVTFH